MWFAGQTWGVTRPECLVHPPLPESSCLQGGGGGLLLALSHPPGIPVCVRVCPRVSLHVRAELCPRKAGAWAQPATAPSWRTLSLTTDTLKVAFLFNWFLFLWVCEFPPSGSWVLPCAPPAPVLSSRGVLRGRVGREAPGGQL